MQLKWYCIVRDPAFADFFLDSEEEGLKRFKQSTWSS